MELLHSDLYFPPYFSQPSQQCLCCSTATQIIKPSQSQPPPFIRRPQTPLRYSLAVTPPVQNKFNQQQQQTMLPPLSSSFQLVTINKKHYSNSMPGLNNNHINNHNNNNNHNRSVQSFKQQHYQPHHQQQQHSPIANRHQHHHHHQNQCQNYEHRRSPYYYNELSCSQQFSDGLNDDDDDVGDDPIAAIINNHSSDDTLFETNPLIHSDPNPNQETNTITMATLSTNDVDEQPTNVVILNSLDEIKLNERGVVELLDQNHNHNDEQHEDFYGFV